MRIGLAAARGLALALDLPGAGVSTLDALAAGAPGALPVIDARRREVFALVGGEPCVLAPDELDVDEGAVCVGDGAVRYRELLEAARRGRPARRRRAAPAARALPRRARAASFGPVDEIEPLYLRVPDAEQERSVTTIELRRLGLDDLARDRGDRAPLVSDAVVALDVRRRAREAELDLPRRVRGGRRGRRARAATSSSRATSTRGT